MIKDKNMTNSNNSLVPYDGHFALFLFISFWCLGANADKSLSPSNHLRYKVRQYLFLTPLDFNPVFKR